MKTRPILFGAPMVRALLAGTKTQTRRVAKPVRHPDLGNLYTPGALVMEHEPRHVIERACPYGQPGDQLWVREAFVQGWPCIDEVPDQFDEEGNEKPIHTWYRATEKSSFSWIGDDGWPSESVPWKPSIHMPRAASRITLEITGARVERLQDISEADAVAEGIEKTEAGFWSLYGQAETDGTYSPIASYRALWSSINGPESWDANPWVWVIDFRRVKS